MDFGKNITYITTIEEILNKFDRPDKRSKTFESFVKFQGLMDDLKTVYTDQEAPTSQKLAHVAILLKYLEDLGDTPQILRAYKGDTYVKAREIASARIVLWTTLDRLLDKMQRNADYFVERRLFKNMSEKTLIETIKLRITGSEIKGTLKKYIDDDQKDVASLDVEIEKEEKKKMGESGIYQ
jgi:hypothetical protein